MATRESVRPLPPITMPPSKTTGAYATVGASVSEASAAAYEPDLLSTEGLKAGAFAPELAIDAQLVELERWAVVNLRRERQQAVRFWVLKGAAFLGTVVAAVSGALGNERLVVGAAALAALCVAIDAAWPPSGFRAHQRAVQDLRELENTVKLKWDKVRLAHPDVTAPSRIAHALALLDHIQTKREEIGKYLGAAGASPDVRVS